MPTTRKTLTTLAPLVRSATLFGYVDVARSLGLAPDAMLRRFGLSLRSLEDPETLVSAQAVRDLLEASAEQSGVKDFALRLVARRTLANLGPISLVLRGEPTPRRALDTLCRYLRLVNASLLTHVDDAGDTVTIRETLLAPHPLPQRQSIEAAVGVMHRILKELIGHQWRPLRVCFSHQPPQELEAHQVFFGTQHVAFGQPFNGIVCRAADLEVSRPLADPGMARIARAYLERALSAHQQDTRETVRQLIVALLPGGRCTAPQVAVHLGVDRRTIHRHLMAQGSSFSSLLDQVRADLVTRQLREGSLPIRQLAELLGFASPSAFGYWFRQRFGCTAGQWRRSQQVGTRVARSPA